MNNTIWKFVLGPQAAMTSILMPKGAEILSAREIDKETIGVWAKVNSNADPCDWERRALWTCFTGHGLPDSDARFIGTAMLFEGAIVAHVFADR